MAERRHNFVAGASNLNDCGQAIAQITVASSPVHSDANATRNDARCLDPSPRRRSNRDINSIRLAGVGRTAHTFYRRMRTLFFSNPSQEEYQTLFLNGSRRRKKYINKNTNVAITATCSNPQYQNAIQVERATKPEEPAIYIIDNFLTNSELEYFDKKIASVSFEKSFVDNLECEDDDKSDEDDDNQNDTKSQNTQHCNITITNDIMRGGNGKSKVCNSRIIDQNQIDVATQMKNHNISRVCNDATSTIIIDAIKKNKRAQKNKKRKRKTMVDDSQRTSMFYSFRKLHDTKISALEQRVANILGCWVHQIEALQLVQYLPGQFFGIHHDLGNLLEDDTVQLPRKELACKRRLVTIFCYLNTLRDDEGGCTYFPKCGHLRVKPKRGRAVLWCNITPDGKADSRTIHAGEAVKSNSGSCMENINDKDKNECQPDGNRGKSIESRSERNVETKKYGLNIWVCEE